MKHARLETVLKDAATHHPNAPAISEWHGHAWLEITYESLMQQSEAFSKALQAHHLTAGERVLVISKNRIQTVIAIVGIWLAEATVVLIDPHLPEPECLDQCKKADARFVVVEKEMAATISNAEYLIVIGDDQLVFQKQAVALSKTVFDDCDSAIAAILFTSGTTGDYKGVMLTHHNFTYLSDQFHYLGDNQTCSLSVLPLFHVAGLFSGIFQPLILGLRVVIFREMHVDALQQAFLHYQPTLFITVPRLLELLDHKIKSSVRERGVMAKSLFTFMLKFSYFSHRYFNMTVRKIVFKSLHQKFGGKLSTILCGSAHLSTVLQKHFLSYGFDVRCSYGLTETCGGITLPTVEHRWRLGTVGFCVDKNDLRINDQHEIIYRGDALMRGYFRDHAATKEAMIDGFFHTKDLGRMDQNGNLFISGRIKELIVFSDGKKAMPEQIEKQYVTIHGMQEYAVFSVEKHGNPIAVLAFVPAVNSDATLTTQQIFEKASLLKSPFRISDVMIVEKLPRSNTLKIKRHQLAHYYGSRGKSEHTDTPIEADHSTEIIQKIILCFQSVLPHKKTPITADITFAELGIDSLTAAHLCDAMNTQLQLSLKPTVFWFSHTIGELSHFITHVKKENTIRTSSTDIQESIAIVAMDCVFPGASNIDIFWKNLVDGKDVITEIPLSRWNNNDYYDAYALAPGKTNSNRGGFIELPIDFPCDQFNIKPRVAATMDPQQKILLMLTKRLLENFSINNPKKTGLFIGAGFSDFMIQQIHQVPLTQINPYSGIGMSDFTLSARVAFHFGFEGPAMVIKTACSSALVAVHQAMRALQAGDCDSAIAGGINVMLVPDISVCLTKGGFLSPDGRCKTFDRDANGYVRSEGCGLVILKRYSDAVRDKNRILSVIVGSAMNQDGASTALAAPNGQSQVDCYRMALDNAKLSPDQISFIESHGSGTQLGDAIEMQSIQAVYDQHRKNKLYVGAVKSSIGHCESAAGIAGLIKTIGVLQHQIIPPNLQYQTPNPNISFENSAVFLPLQKTIFEKKCDYAAVSSFGVAGTNVHMILKH